MNPLQAIPTAPLRRCGPPGSSLSPAGDAPTPAAADRTEVTGPCEPGSPRRSLARRLLRAAGWTGLAATGLLGVVAGIGVSGNQAAFSEPPTVSLALDLEAQLDQKPAPPGFRAPPVEAPRAPAASPAAAAPAPPQGGIAVMVPAPTAADFVHSLQQRPQVEALLEQRLAEVARTINGELAAVTPPGGELLLDLELPLPTGEQAFLHLGKVDLPSFGVRSLRREKVPLALEVDLARVETGLRLQIERTAHDRPARPDSLEGAGIYLGSVRVRLLSDREEIPVRGSARLKLDLDGASTRPVRERLEQRLAAAPEAQQLREQEQALANRQQQARRLGELGREQGYGSLLEQAFGEQRVNFDLRVRSNQGPLAEAVFHLWLGQDVTSDGRSDLHVAHQLDLERLSTLSLEIRDLARQGEPPQSWLGRLANAQVEKHFLDGIRETVGRAAEDLRQEAVRRAEEELGKAIPRVVEHGNEELEQLYRSGRGIQLPTSGPVTSDATLSLAGIRLSRGLLVVDFDGVTAAHPRTAVLPALMKLAPGELAVSISGEELSRQLQEGGVVRWEQVLEQVNRQDIPYRLSLARDPLGRTLYPRWFSDGQGPALILELQLDRRADQQGRARRLLASLGPAQLQRRVVVPLELQVREGDIAVGPRADSVRLEKPGPDLSLKTGDLVPTEALTSLILRTVLAAEGGPDGIRLGLPLADSGLEVREIGTVPAEGGAPNVVVKLKTHPRALDVAGQRLAEVSLPRASPGP